MGKFLNQVRNAATLLAGGLVLAGCAGRIEHPDGHTMALNSDQFRSYVEATFRHQNRVADSLAFALLDRESAAPNNPIHSLETAEEHLIAACAGVNELATAERDGTRLSLLAKRGLARQVADCQKAADSAERILMAL